MTEILGKGDAGVQLLRKSESLLAKLAPVLRQGSSVQQGTCLPVALVARDGSPCYISLQEE